MFGVFYGQDGVFVSPVHRVVTISASEGYDVTVIPCVLADDCLYTDHLIEPSHPGCQTLEARVVLLRFATDCSHYRVSGGRRW